MMLFKAFLILSVICSLIIQPNTAAMDANETQTRANVTTGLKDSDWAYGHIPKLPRLLPPSCPKRCKCPPPPPPPCPKKCKCPPPPPPKKKPKPPPPCPKNCRCPIPPPPPPKCPKCKCPSPTHD